ncbi:hypothetical protein Dimus_035031 [Dionaea muscipula]
MDVLLYFIIVGNWLCFRNVTTTFLYINFRQLEKALGNRKNPLAYDIRAACSGFVLGLVSVACHVRGTSDFDFFAAQIQIHSDISSLPCYVLQNLIISLSKTCTGGGFRNVLVIAADALSRFIDWSDRGVCILFGDADGAVVVRQEYPAWPPGCLDPVGARLDLIGSRLAPVGACESEEDGLFGFDLHSDGEGRRRSSDLLLEVCHCQLCLPLRRAGMSSSSIDWLLLHQANQRMMDAVAGRLEVPIEHVLSNIANYGNTSAVPIPLAWHWMKLFTVEKCCLGTSLLPQDSVLV